MASTARPIPVEAIRFEQARKRAGLSIQEVSERSGVSDQTLYRLQRGALRRAPQMRTIRAIAGALGCTTADLLLPEPTETTDKACA